MLKQLKSSKAFTLFEMLIVVTIIAILGSLAVPSLINSRNNAKAAATKNALRIIEQAKGQYAIAHDSKEGDVVSFGELKAFLQKDTALYNSTDALDALGNPITINAIDTAPQVADATAVALAVVAPVATYWGQYAPATTTP